MKEEKQLKHAYNQIAEDYLFTRTKGKGINGFQNREIEQPIMLKLVPKNLKNKKLLDIGCGPAIHLEEYIKRGAIGTGIDISDKMIDLAKKRCPKGNFKVGSMYNLEFEVNSFDIVTASFLLDHVKYLDNGIKEVKKVLKSGGLFIFSVPHPITFMFRDFEKDKFVPSHSYFDKHTHYYNMANTGKMLPGYPRQLQEYFQTLLKHDFILEEFLENKPKNSWKEKYKDFDENFLKFPILCFFRWRKA